MSRSRVLVRVPASTSNLGPGFDCLGLGLQLYNTTTVSRNDRARPHHGMIAETAAAFFGQTGIEPFGYEAKVEGDIPISRGLGSSVSVRLGVLMGLAELAGETAAVPPAQILKIVIDLEGHPDNAVASFLGGFAVCSRAGENPSDGFGHARVAVGPELSFVTLVPGLRLSTEMARGLLPAEVPFRHAIENAQRTARIAATFCNRDYASLRGLFIDHLHQPFRRALIPGFTEILDAAVRAGALGSFLSGAGSSLMAVTLGPVDAIAAAMLDAAQRCDLDAKILVLKADNDGAKVLPEA